MLPRTKTQPLTLIAAAVALSIGANAAEAGSTANKKPVTPPPVIPGATEYDLTGANASGRVDVGGARFQRTDVQPTGSGVIRPFVRLQSPGNGTTEQGYNTSLRPLQFDENNSPQFTRSLSMDDLSPVRLNGASYYQFLLDVNEPNGRGRELLSLDELELYQSNSATLTNYDSGNKFGQSATLVYDLDAGGDSFLKLDSNLMSGGSGSGDLFAFIPASAFDPDREFLYLFSRFGDHHAAEGGFEEWAALRGDPALVPLPAAASSGLVTLGLLLGGAACRRLRARRCQA